MLLQGVNGMNADLNFERTSHPFCSKFGFLLSLSPVLTSLLIVKYNTITPKSVSERK
jgi:hypothetical protein